MTPILWTKFNRIYQRNVSKTALYMIGLFFPQLINLISIGSSCHVHWLHIYKNVVSCTLTPYPYVMYINSFFLKKKHLYLALKFKIFCQHSNPLIKVYVIVYNYVWIILLEHVSFTIHIAYIHHYCMTMVNYLNNLLHKTHACNNRLCKHPLLL